MSKKRFSKPRTTNKPNILQTTQTTEDRNKNQLLRRSNAAGVHKQQKSRSAQKQQAIKQSLTD